MLIPTRIDDDQDTTNAPWCLMDHATADIELRLQFQHWWDAERESIEHPSFYWVQLGKGMMVA